MTFRPLTRRTHGLSVTVVAPWEGHPGYLTTVAWRYGGESVGNEVPGSIAFVPTTQSWLRPMREARDGVLGSQDVNICG